jgi:hypothetical protein
MRKQTAKQAKQSADETIYNELFAIYAKRVNNAKIAMELICEVNGFDCGELRTLASNHITTLYDNGMHLQYIDESEYALNESIFCSSIVDYLLINGKSFVPKAKKKALKQFAELLFEEAVSVELQYSILDRHNLSV